MVCPHQVSSRSEKNCTRESVNGTWQVKFINQLIKRSFNELHLQQTNLAEILAQGVPPPSFTTIREELHTGERKRGLAGQIN